jgi:membrane protein implicated in regulation of membrane protease activity
VIEAVFFLVVASAAAYLLAPMFRRTEVPSPDPHRALEAAQASALRSLYDLELDWGTGKLSDEDYRIQRAALEGELAAIVRKMSAPPAP